MDRKVYMDSFERLLKEKSDEFRMYPTRKVWHSIYNNIYPGRKWPSAIISVLLITTLPFIGLLNTNTQHSGFEKNFAAITTAKKYIGLSTSGMVTNSSISAVVGKGELYKPVSVQSLIMVNNQKRPNQVVQQLPLRHNLNRLAVNTEKANLTSFDKDDMANNSKPVISEKDALSILDNTTDKNIAAENYALQNIEPAKKRSDKLALQIYASPSIIYGIPSSGQTNLSFAEGQEATNLINQNIGLEAGTAMQYSLSKILKLKAGLQFNYASYDIAAQSGHLIAAPLISNDPAITNADMLARVSDYSSTASPVTLHNEMYQFSLPVGLELKLLKHNNFQWNAGATIQPTYTAGGNAYLLSSDSHIDESSLINRWNLNAGFETFITYKVNDITWQLGPQFRYQFSPTYGKAYSGVDEKLAIFGVKIGITKALH